MRVGYLSGLVVKTPSNCKQLLIHIGVISRLRVRASPRYVIINYPTTLTITNKFVGSTHNHSFLISQRHGKSPECEMLWLRMLSLAPLEVYVSFFPTQNGQKLGWLGWVAYRRSTTCWIRDGMSRARWSQSSWIQKKLPSELGVGTMRSMGAARSSSGSPPL